MRVADSSRLGSLIAVAAFLGTVLMAQTSDVQIRFEPQVIAQNLEAVWALAFAPDGRLFLTERSLMRRGHSPQDATDPFKRYTKIVFDTDDSGDQVRKFKAQMKRGEVVTLRNTDHVAFLHDPAQVKIVVAEMQRFLR